MARGRLDRVSVSEFKGMDLSIAPTKLAPGVGQLDVNGRRGRPFVGSWGTRRGYQRLCLAGAGIFKESSAINSMFQFSPPTNVNWVGLRGNINTTQDSSTLILVTDGGTIEAYAGVQPRE